MNKLIVDTEQSYQVYTKNGITKFYVNGSEVENVKRVKIYYDVEFGKPKVIFEIDGTTSTDINVATLNKDDEIGYI